MIISRHLKKELFCMVLAISVVLLLIFMSKQFVHYLHSAASGQLSVEAVMWLIWLQMPSLLSVLLPLAVFLTILFVYGRMYADNEMTILFASGLSAGNIYRITTTFIFTGAIVVAFLALKLGPYFNRYAASILSKNALSTLELIQPGRFHSFKNGHLIIYFKDKAKKKILLKKIFVANNVGHMASDIITSKTAEKYYDKKTGDTFLVFKHGNRYIGTPGENDYQIVNFAKYGVRVENQLSSRNKVNAISTSDLWRFSDTNKKIAELQWRISMPIMTIILGFLGVPLSRVKSRRNRFAQFVPAILLYIIYGNFMFVGRGWIQNGVVSTNFGMWWVHIIMAIITIFVITNQRGWR